MRFTPRTETEAQKIAQRTLLRPGWHNGRIRDATQRPSKAGNEMIEVCVVITDADGNEREFRDYFTDAAVNAVKLRHICEAIGALARYEAGEIEPADFPGHEVHVRIGLQKQRGWPDRNVIEDYRAAESRVANLPEAR